MGYRRALLFLYPTFLDIKFLYPTQSKQSFFPTTPPKQLSSQQMTSILPYLVFLLPQLHLRLFSPLLLKL